MPLVFPDYESPPVVRWRSPVVRCELPFSPLSLLTAPPHAYRSACRPTGRLPLIVRLLSSFFSLSRSRFFYWVKTAATFRPQHSSYYFRLQSLDVGRPLTSAYLFPPRPRLAAGACAQKTRTPLGIRVLFLCRLLFRLSDLAVCEAFDLFLLSFGEVFAPLSRPSVRLPTCSRRDALCGWRVCTKNADSVRNPRLIFV